MQPTFETFEKELNRLVSQFERDQVALKSPGYAEARLRTDYLDPFFLALGWDLGNTLGLVQNKREVEIESRTDIGGRIKRADYLFRTDGTDRFVCEAKKPREGLDSAAAFQAKRYAWNNTVPVALLSDFEEMKIYIVGSGPHIDRPEEGEWKSYGFRQYPLHARELWDLFAREGVAAGSIDKAIDALPKRSKIPGKARQQWLIKPDRSRNLDNDFLAFLDEQRRALGSDLLKHNPTDTALREVTRLTEAAQRILDRLLFLRICEDRDIDIGTSLAAIVETWRRNHNRDDTRRAKQTSLFDGGSEPSARTSDELPRESLWFAIVRHFRALDRRPPSHVPFFNGNLFKHHFTEDILVGDQWLCDLIGKISDDGSRYLFSTISVEILGSVYERFLGKIVRPQGRGVTIEDKPEVRKAGGVYYTPRYIVDYIVEQTLGRQLDAIATAKTFATFEKNTCALRALDPACGSGSFLIRVFERICEHYQARFLHHPKEQKPDLCWLDPATRDIHLTVELKRRILRDNVYGVDLDAQAVEVTQLSLYLKMLEGENRTTLQRQRELLTDKAEIALLPPLQDNIKCGNSLIASDFSLDTDDLIRVNAFNWEVQFKDIVRGGGFDAVVGNPPYIRIQTMQKSDASTVSFFKEKFAAAAKGNYDIYVLFVELSLALAKSRGSVGFILPNRFLNAEYGAPLRSILGSGQNLDEIVHFGANQVFEGATTYTCMLFVSPQKSGSFIFRSVDDLKKWRTKRIAETATISSAKLSSAPWSFSAGAGAELIDQLKSMPEKLGGVADIFVGLQTSADDVFIMDFVSEAKGTMTLRSKAKGEEVTLEKDLLHPLASGTDVHGYAALPARQFILFPYAVTDETATLIPWRTIEDDYPLVGEYLTAMKAKLCARENGKFRDAQWYRFGRSQNLGIQSRKKLCVPRLVDRLCSASDLEGGHFLDNVDVGGVTWKPAHADHDYRYLLALLNSRLLGWFFPNVSAPFRGGWYSANRQFLSQVPFRSIDFSAKPDRARHDKLVTLVDKMLIFTPKLRDAKNDAERSTLQNAITATDQQIDALVYELYGLTAAEIALVENTAQ